MKKAKEKTRKQVIRDAIKKKFKNLSRFGKIAGYEPTYLHNLFKKKDTDELETVYKVALETNDRPLENELTDQEREDLQHYINDHYDGNITAFCRDKNVWIMTVDHILKGRRRFKTDLVIAALEAAEIGRETAETELTQPV